MISIPERGQGITSLRVVVPSAVGKNVFPRGEGTATRRLVIT